MKRREFITLLGGAAAWPVAARGAAAERVRRVGVLIASAESDLERQKDVRAFQEALQDLGWVDGRNIQIDIRWAPNGEFDAAICEGPRRAAARCHSFSNHIRHAGNPSANAHHSYPFRRFKRSRRQWLRAELPQARRQCHWFH